jgi:hypothetical protein
MGEWMLDPASHPGSMGGWVGPTACLDDVENIISDPFVIQPIASALPAPSQLKVMTVNFYQVYKQESRHTKMWLISHTVLIFNTIPSKLSAK